MIGIFNPCFAFFSPKMTVIDTFSLSKLICSSNFGDLPPFCRRAHQTMHILNKVPTSYGNAFRPFIILFITIFFQTTLNPTFMSDFHLIVGFESKKFSESFIIYQSVSLSRVLNFVIAATVPLGGAPYNTRPYHIEIDIYKALQEMIAFLNSCGMITVLPESAFPVLALIKFLPYSPGYQLDCIWYDITISIIDNEKMDMI